MTEAEASDANIEERDRFLRVTSVKGNMKVAPKDAIWRELVSVPANNSDRFGRTDSIGVATPWKWPTKAEHPSRPTNFWRFSEWRYSEQAGNWAGYAVGEIMGLNVADKGDKARVRRLLANWLSLGSLKIEMRKDAHRKDRPFVVVGQRLDDLNELAAKASKPAT
jgi:hypothetical protein